MLIAYIHWFEKNNLLSAGFVCCLFLQLTDGGAVSVHNMQTHFICQLQLLSDYNFFNCPL
jgi:hypothetical protein